MKTRLTLIVLLAAAGLVEGADVTLPPSPTVIQLVDEALQHNPELQYFQAELDAARSVERRAGRLAHPEVSGSVGRKRAEDPGGRLAGEGTAWSVGVMQTFEWPGRIGLRKAIANQDVLLAELGLARFKQAVASRVRGQFQALSAGVEKARVAREVADRYRALREVLVQRDPSGITPQLELRILEATEITLRRRASESELAAYNARSSLNLLLGRPADSALNASTSVVDLPVPPPRESLLAAAQTNNFDLRLRTAELQQQSFRVSLTQNERWPAIKVGPQFSQENANGQDSILGLGITFPLPLWRNNSANVEAAHSRHAQAEALLNSARREVERKVIAAAQAYEAKRAELALWQPNSVATFAEAAELADRHYRLAAVPATTYVELQKQYLEAVETLLETRREAILAASEIEELTGISVLETR